MPGGRVCTDVGEAFSLDAFGKDITGPAEGSDFRIAAAGGSHKILESASRKAGPGSFAAGLNEAKETGSLTRVAQLGAGAAANQAFPVRESNKAGFWIRLLDHVYFIDSSSTSKTRVALGPISRPAPRSP